MKLIYFKSISGQKIAIPMDKITGVTEATNMGNTYIATGADDVDGGENGWYVAEKFTAVCMILEACG